MFAAEHGRPPADAREVSGTIAKHSRPARRRSPAYDLTFSPVKSVSTLWAVADPQVAAQIEGAHHAAVKTHSSSWSNTPRSPGKGGKVSGRSTSAAWWRRRSRIGTAAPATRIYTPMWRWRTRSKPSTAAGCPSTDGCCSKPTVAASETYNTALEQHLRDRLGIRFADRPDTDSGKRPVREIVGVDRALNERWSTRRVLIKDRQGELAISFSVIMVARQPLWRRCNWRSRPPWRPGIPSTNPAP